MNTKTAIQAFDFNSSIVRVVTCDESPWFVANDVCKVLGLENSRDAVSGLDEDEKNTVAIADGNRGNPNKTIISESGLYALIFKSRKAEAKKFRRWVTGTVLPAIRQTGRFEAGPGAAAGEALGQRVMGRAERQAGLRSICEFLDFKYTDLKIQKWELEWDEIKRFGFEVRRAAEAFGIESGVRRGPDGCRVHLYPPETLETVWQVIAQPWLNRRRHCAQIAAGRAAEVAAAMPA